MCLLMLKVLGLETYIKVDSSKDLFAELYQSLYSIYFSQRLWMKGSKFYYSHKKRKDSLET